MGIEGVEGMDGNWGPALLGRRQRVRIRRAG